MEDAGVPEGPFFLHRADTKEARESAWALVQSRYVEMGYADAHAPPWRVTPYDLDEGTRTFFTDAGPGTPVLSTFTLVADGPRGLPMDAGWGPEVEQLRLEGRTLREATKLAARTSGLEYLLPLIRVALLESRRGGATDILLTVNPRHRGFYKKVLGFTELAPVGAVASVKGAPGVPLRFDIAAASEFFQRAYGHLSGPSNLHEYLFGCEALAIDRWLRRPYHGLDDDQRWYFFGCSDQEDE